VAAVEDWSTNCFLMLHRFKAYRTKHAGEIPIWMKVRVDPTMREHAIIDNYIGNLAPADSDFAFEKHESGPEALVYIAVTAAGITLAACG
jgi:hypothetical protein